MFNENGCILNIFPRIKKPAIAGIYLIDLNLILIQSIFQAFTGLKAWHLGGLDLQSSTCAWVTTCASSTLAHAESTKTNQSHGIAFFEGLLDCLNDGSERTCGGSFRNVRFGCDVFNQFGLVHGLVPIVSLVTSNADLISLLKLMPQRNTPISVFIDLASISHAHAFVTTTLSEHTQTT
jgi:hypothetical protein